MKFNLSIVMIAIIILLVIIGITIYYMGNSVNKSVITNSDTSNSNVSVSNSVTKIIKNKIKLKCESGKKVACITDKSDNDIYKLHHNYKQFRDKNKMIANHNLDNSIKGPKNIFIIRHGEKISGNLSLDCNGILRSTYVPKLVKGLNDMGYGFTDIITTYDYTTMHQQQTVMLTSWLMDIPLFIYGDCRQSLVAVQTIFSNPYYNGKTILFCWEHTCIQALIQSIISVAPKAKGIANYQFKNPQGNSGLPHWDHNNFQSVIHFDNNLNYKVYEEGIKTCNKKDNDILTYGIYQNCIGSI
jgi:hypothetical protein